MAIARRMLLVLLVVAPGCVERQRYDVVDSLGVRFAIESQDGEAFLFEQPTEDPLACPTELGTPTWALAIGWMLELCAACDDERGTTISPNDCRPAVCDGDGECPRVGEDVYACVKGLCQNEALVEDPIPMLTAELLCRADVPRDSLEPLR